MATCVRDFIHVNDLAEAHALALHKIMTTGESLVLNLGTGTGHSVREVLAAVEQITGCEVPHKIVPRRAGDPPVLVADASRAEAALGWKARRNLTDIIATAWNWMQKRAAITA